MFDVQHFTLDRDSVTPSVQVSGDKRGARHWSKLLFDLVLAGLFLWPLAVITVVLLVVNPFLNKGPLFFQQARMGLGCRAFTVVKFRTMSQVTGTSGVRGAFDALEADRISRFGRFLRRTRIDELPQIINVLRGEMSLIGPRPDSYEHASVYLDRVPGYRTRHDILPGISGFAQTEVGYVDGIDGISHKVAADLHYLAHVSFRLDLWIFWRTLCVVVGRKGR